MSDLSVVVPSWNTRELLCGCLASLERARAEGPLRLEVIVVDNGSRDGSAERVRTAFPWVRLIANAANRGFAAACNQGLAARRGRHALLLNSDARVDAAALAACVAHLDAHEDVGIVGPGLCHPDGSRQRSAHRYPALATEIVPAPLVQRLRPGRHPWERSVAGAFDVEAVRGAALFARGDLVRAIGPLPEQYFFFLEETAWCWRARAAGWRVVYLPGILVTHEAGASSKRRSPGRTRIEYHRSLYRFYREHHGAGSMLMALTIRLTKTLFYLVAHAPPAVVSRAGRRRWRVHRDVLRWHLRGCPAAGGLARATPRPGTA